MFVHSLKKILPAFFINKIIDRVGLQKIIHNTGWLFVDKILRMGVGLVVGMWVARYLGPQKYGQWNYAIAFSSLFGVFASLGLDSIVVREIVKSPERRNEVLGSAFFMKLMASIISLFITAIAITFVKSQDRLTLYLVVLSSAGVVFQSLNTIDFYFQSQLKSKYTVYAQNSAFLIISIFKVVLLLNKASLLAFAFTGLIEIILASAFLIYAYRYDQLSIRDWKFDYQIAEKLLKESWPLILTSLAIVIYMRVDQVMLGKILGDKEVGLYSAAIRISEIWYFIPMSISSSIYPALIAAKERGEAYYKKRLHQIFFAMLCVSIPIACLIATMSNFIVNVLYGSEYNGAGKVLAAHIWAGVPLFIGLGYGKMFIIEGFIKISFYLTLLNAVINILLNFLLIPEFGIQGAAIATTITQFVSFFIGIVYLNKKCRLF